MSAAAEAIETKHLSGLVKRFVMRFAILSVLFYRDFTTGQKYIFRDHVNSKNPFKHEEKPLIVEILDVRNGWIRYKHVGSTIRQDESMEISAFNFCFMFLYA